ncbi:segregation/condensation protein A [bacterium (candidate division B38) B3_B38]|nr:MAG: segregation/condensation protein A [bacterium (candidate division B38) B3_B38]
MEQEAGTEFKVRLPAFEGPLDLLLHIIHTEQIDIYDIPIASITRQYLDYLNLMTELNLDIASEFLLMAATLIYMKSKMLVPQPIPEIDKEEFYCLRTELTTQLLEHQKFQQAARLLREKEKEHSTLWSRSELTSAAPPRQEDVLLEATVFDIVSAFYKVLESRKEEKPLHLLPERYTVEEKMEEIVERLHQEERLRFFNLARELQSREELIVTFLALLELVRQQLILLYQTRKFRDILILPAMKKGAKGDGKGGA